jgi:hypothetical protein
MRVVVAFCLHTGVVWDCALGATKLSEQVLATQLLARPRLNTLFVADRNFGVCSVVRAVRAAQAQILVRMTRFRAAKLAREAGVSLQVGLDVLIEWNPSAHDQCPEGLTRQPVAGRVERPGFRRLDLYWFTTLTETQTYSAADLAQLYGQRWQVERNLRYVKTEMDLGALEGKSAEMARKEWLAGLLAYNLIRSVMVMATARAHRPVLERSFSRARQLCQLWLIRWGRRPKANRHHWEQLLELIGRCRHPKRPKPRPPEPRAIRYFKQDFPRLNGDRASARAEVKKNNAKS